MTQKVIDILEKLRTELNKWYDMLDEMANDCDQSFSDLLDEIKNKEPQKKLKKAEQKEIMKRMLTEKFPEFNKAFNEFDLITETIKIRIEESEDKLQEVQDNLDELESLQEEIEEKKNELDL